MSGDGRNFQWTARAAVSGTSLWLGVTGTAPFRNDRQIKSIFTCHCPHELSLTVFNNCTLTEFNNVVVCIQVCDNRRTQTLYWRYFLASSMAKIVDLWLQSFEAPALLQLLRKALSVTSQR